MVEVDSGEIRKIGAVLNDPNRPLKERFRALFTLKNLAGGEAIKSISDCFGDSSALLKHELAYCLGQMQDPAAIPYLVKVLEDKSQEPMVRHEAGKLNRSGAFSKAANANPINSNQLQAKHSVLSVIRTLCPFCKNI